LPYITNYIKTMVGENMLKERVVVKGNVDDDLYGKEGIIVATNTRFYEEPGGLNEHTVCKVLIGNIISKWLDSLWLEKVTMEIQ
jgi:hypothetical protein